MRLRTKLVLWATALTFAIVLVMSALFLTELLRQRIEQTASSNEVQAHEVVLMTRQAVEQGLRERPPRDRTEAGLYPAVKEALRDNVALSDVMNAIVRYSPTVQDVSVTDARGRTLVSTDPDAIDDVIPPRTDLGKVRDGNFLFQGRHVFGRAQVLDLTEPLQRNGQPFLVVHVGVRSTFVRASYEPWLKAALLFALLGAVGAVVAAALLATAALSPIEQISRQLDVLTSGGAEEELPAPRLRSQLNPLSLREGPDTVVRVTQTIDRLGQQMRTTEAGYTALQANLNQMLDTLRDGVLLVTADGRAVMVSDAVEYFLNKPESEMAGKQIEEIFEPDTKLGAAVLSAFVRRQTVSGQILTMEDGRRVQISLDRIDDGTGSGGAMGTLLTLRDMESAAQLEQELEVSRRLAAIGRLTAGVGHEVKNPINAMVVHLELLKTKLANGNGAAAGAQRHVDILAGEMQRLDRVVQTLADFTRPMELHLKECNLREVVQAVVELIGAEMDDNGVQLTIETPRDPLMVRVDPELLQQALLNLVLNAMQAMPGGGLIRITMHREHHFAVIDVTDQGEGIAEEVLPRIFDLYFTTKAKGSGIGLAMTYRILQIHGGAMDVRSNPDPQAAERGTTFTVRLPLAPMTTNETRKATMTQRTLSATGEQV